MARDSTNPFTIGIAKNDAMNCFDLVLQIGGLTSDNQAKQLADLLAQWLTEEGGWLAKIN